MTYNTKILYWNCQGIRNKQPELRQLSQQLKIQIILLNETHLNEKFQLNLPNFHTYRTDRPRSLTGISAGGTAVLIHRSISHQEIKVQTTSIENTTLLIKLNGIETRISAVYKRPNSTLNCNDIDTLLGEDNQCILAGDLNAKHNSWNSLTQNSAGIALHQHSHHKDYLVAAPVSPTHYPDNHAHRPDVLDIAILNHLSVPFQISNINNLSSDHNPILLELQGNSYVSPWPQIKNFINWNKFATDVHQAIETPNPSISNIVELDHAVENFTNILKSALTKNTRETRVQSNQHHLPSTILEQIEKKKRLRRLWQHTRNPEYKSRFNHQTSLVKNLMDKFRNLEWERFLSTSKPNDPKIFKINKSLITKNPPTTPLKNNQGTLVFEPHEKAELLTNTLAEQFNCPSGCLITEAEVSNRIQILKEQCSSSIKPLSPNEIKGLIKLLPIRKAPGLDKIPNVALKRLSEKAILHLTKIFNCCFRLKHFPKPFKIATIIMIPKRGKDLSIPKNHRPISLLNTLAKLLETAILTRLRREIMTYIRPEQFAFRSEHSTTNQLTKFVDHLSNATNRGERTAAAFLDFEKAFDKIWHDGLKFKLLQMNVSIPLVKLLSSFLEKRSYLVRINDTHSSTRELSAGVPQGSCLSPLLFAAYINDFPTLPGVRINLFADDTMFYYTSMSCRLATEKIQKQIDHTLPWLYKWKLTLNTEKTVAVQFGKKLKKTKQLLINDLRIPWSNNIRYLGVNIDKHLKFSKHVSEITSSARRVRGALYPVLSRWSPLSMKTKLSIYKMYILSRITYASPAWGAFISPTNWRSLETIQSSTTRIISDSPWFVRNASISNSFNLPTVRETITKSAQRFFEKQSNSSHAHLSEIGKNPGPPEIHRPRPHSLTK